MYNSHSKKKKVLYEVQHGSYRIFWEKNQGLLFPNNIK